MVSINADFYEVTLTLTFQIRLINKFHNRHVKDNLPREQDPANIQIYIFKKLTKNTGTGTIIFL